METIKNYYDNGILKEEYSLNSDGKKEGHYKFYYPNGGIKKKGVYINQQLDGEYIEYFNNSNTYFIENFNNGVQEGEYKKYFNNGQLKIKSNYENNQLNGDYISYHQNGNVNIIAKYKNNKKIDIEKEHDIQGALIKTTDWSNLI
jgi:antitoxin component YwqK of YwqJK toxin-antitoxin module